MERTRRERARRWARGLIAVAVAMSLSGWTVTPTTGWPGGAMLGCPTRAEWESLSLTPSVQGLYLCREGGPYGQAYLANGTRQVWVVTTTLADPQYPYIYVRSTARSKLFRAMASPKVKYALPGEVLLLPPSFMQNSFTPDRTLTTRWMLQGELATAIPVGATALAKKSSTFKALKTCFAAGWTTGGALGALQDGSGTDAAIGAGLGAAARAGKCKSAVNRVQGKADSSAVRKFQAWVTDAQGIRSWSGRAAELEGMLQQAIRAHLIP
jgi:hypothetical protein